MSNKAFFDDYYGQLKGFQIVKYEMDTEEDEFGYREFPTFILQRGQQQIRIAVSRDEEGNDGGFLFIEDSKEVV